MNLLHYGAIESLDELRAVTRIAPLQEKQLVSSLALPTPPFLFARGVKNGGVGDTLLFFP